MQTDKQIVNIGCLIIFLIIFYMAAITGQWWIIGGGVVIWIIANFVIYNI